MKTEKNLRNFMDSVPYALIHYDEEMNLIDINKTALQMMGVSKAELIGKNILDIESNLKSSDRYKKYKEVIKTGNTFFTEDCSLEQKHGDLHVSVKAFKVRNGLGLIFTDITNSKESESMFAEREAFNITLFQFIPIDTIVVDRNGRIIKFNIEKEKSGDRLPNIGDIMYKDYANKHEIDMYAELMGCIKLEGKKKFSVLKYGANYLSIRIVSIPGGAIITSQNITNQIHAEKELTESEKKFRLLFERSNDPIVLTDQTAKPLWGNPAWEDYFGSESKNDEDPFIPIQPKYREKFSTEWQNLVSGKGIIRNSEYGYQDINGNNLIFETSAFPVEISNEILYFILSHNITERKQTELALIESEEKYRKLFENDLDALMILDSETMRYEDANKTTLKLFGFLKEEFITLKAEDIFKEKAKKRNALHETLSRNTESGEIPVRYLKKKDGTVFSGEISADNFFSKGNEKTLVKVRDITERINAEKEKKKLQAQLIHSEKMAGLGTMASGIAHEFNNLIQIMSGYVQLAQKTKKPEDIREAFDIVLSTTDKLTKIIKDLLTFSRVEIPEKEMCSIRKPLEGVLSLIEKQLIKNNIYIVRKYGRSSRLWINEGEVQQVFLNFLTNARDAMQPKGGNLEIEIRQKESQVRVSFHDSGKGVREEDMERLFEPFFTTKGALGGNEAIEGTGLGLSVSFGIVKSHGGTIEVKSERGKGTTFTVSLPAKRGKAK